MGRKIRVARRNINISYLRCPDCKNEFPIPRTHKTRKRNHKKFFYCTFCKERKNMLEIRSVDFKEEMNINASV